LVICGALDQITPAAEMRAMTEDRIADVTEMRNLRVVENDAVFELARVAHDDAVPDDHIFAHITTAADMAVFANPGRTFHHRALLDDGAGADENRTADERLAHEFAEHRRLEAKLEITRNLFERVPNIFLRLEEFRVRSVLQVEEFRGAKHCR